MAEDYERPNDEPETWQTFVLDESGFVVDPDVLDHVDDHDMIERLWGDCIPDKITLCHRDAKPRRQGRDTTSDSFRIPSGRYTEEFIDFDLFGEGNPVRAQYQWVVAQAGAKALNGG